MNCSMKISLVLVVCGLVLLLNVPYSCGLAIGNAESNDRIPNEYLVKLNIKEWLIKNDGVSKDEKIADMVKKIRQAGKDIEVVESYVFEKIAILFVRCSVETSVASLLLLPEIELVEANVQVKGFSTCERQRFQSSEWNLPRIARRNQSGEPTYDYMSDDGEDTVAYILDTGIYIQNKHFEDRASYGFVATAHRLEGHNDLNGHGTHCAGTVMSDDFGVAKKANTISVKVLNFLGIGSITSILEGLEWVFQNFTDSESDFKAVASMSLGASGDQITMNEAVQELIDAGLPVVVAAGNNDGNACSYSPAKLEDAITVGASDLSDELAIYSNWGSCVDIIAPGTDIKSTANTHDTSTQIMSGTSMAAPHVAGAVLRYMSQLDRRPSPKDVKEWLLASSTVGRLNLRGASETPNLLLHAPCNVSVIVTDPNAANVVSNTWVFVLLTAFLTCVLMS